ncbi:hypothetical protein BC477_08455 [Clavibacter michiganensis subsp. michiganensis]|uniref:Uncharacterized protein n=1 Tax=Clavibacter michiganensis subsp. michiganensis TaxID=33013 RepID=A0A251XMN5_CLAMM|nr:hypothetical protein BC477_08455 [Clavibacter michiganensis subsp. michiganensis]OUE04754.1 hypothetical protein CMMCAS07_07385 [Clavibacter michiganensis subsp. michiganensis]
MLERDRPAGMLGSSHGSARILRYAYDDPFYVRLMRDAACSGTGSSAPRARGS